LLSHAAASSLSYYLCPVTSASSTPSLHDALPISRRFPRVQPEAASGDGSSRNRRRRIDPADRLAGRAFQFRSVALERPPEKQGRSEEHTSELQSPDHLVCRLLLDKKNNTRTYITS